MKDSTSEGDGFTLNLLFFSAGEVDFCVDTEQLESMLAYFGEESDDLVWLHEELGVVPAAIGRNPVVFKIKTGDGASYRVITDRMTDIVATDCRDIRPMPPLIELFALKKGLWGVLPRDGRLVLVIDFLLLAREKVATKEIDTQPAPCSNNPLESLLSV